MERNRLTAISTLTAALGLAAFSLAQAPGDIVALVDPDGSPWRYTPQAISGDGRVVYGEYFFAESRSFRWTRSEGIAPVPLFSRYGVFGMATSQDGQRLVASVANEDGLGDFSEVLLLSGVDGSVIANLSGANRSAHSVAMSRDGSTVLGRVFNHDTNGNLSVYPIAWRDGEAPIRLSAPGAANGYCISADARVIGGSAHVDGRSRATLWREFGGPTYLPEYPDARSAGVAGLSADGSIISQIISLDPEFLDFFSVLWSEAGGFEMITDSIYGLTAINLHFLTPDANHMYGSARNSAGVDIPVIWERGRGVMPLGVVMAELGVGADRWFFGETTRITGMSEDGRVLIGRAYSAEHGSVGFVATIPAPASAALVFAGAWVARRRKRVVY